MSSMEYHSSHEPSVEELLEFCREVELLRPFCSLDEEESSTLTLERPVAPGKIAVVTMCEVEVPVFSDDESDDSEKVDDLVVYKLEVTETRIEESGKGVMIQQSYAVFESQGSPEETFSDDADHYFVTDDSGQNWEEQREPILKLMDEAMELREQGDEEAASELFDKIKEILEKSRELTELTGEGLGTRSRHLAAMAIVAVIQRSVGIKAE
jgi:hypothetical protein